MLTPGTRVGPYEIRDVLGSGSLAAVYRALDSRSGREVALKVLSQRVSRDLDSALRFEREARSVAGLAHPNIIHIYDVGRDGPNVYAAMELNEGVSLRKILQARAMDPSEAIAYACGIGEAVAFAHSHGVIHRDLKPENIMIGPDGSVKVLDFSIVRTVEPASFDSMEVTAQHFHMRNGAVVGTLGYLPPEQLSGEPVDARGDIYSFGCVLYEMLAGNQPFLGGSAPERMTAIFTTSPPPLPPGRVAPALERTVLRCLEKEPHDRFASMKEVLAELRPHLAASGAQVMPAPPSAPPSPGHGVWRLIAGILIAVGLGGLAVAVWLLSTR